MIFSYSACAAGRIARAFFSFTIIYYKGKVIGGIYDDRLLVKPTKSANHLLPNATLEALYPGAKDMIFVEDVDNRELLAKLLDGMVEELPTRKKR